MLNLTEREKIVLYGLVRYPELNDIELAQKINIKRPTITAIRNRLEKQEIYTTKKIPDLTRLGCELITITHTQYNPITPYNTRKKTKKQNPNTFLEIQTDTQQLTISAEKNYTQTKKQTEEHIRFNDKLRYSKRKQITDIVFPVDLTLLLMDFEFGPLLKKVFSLDDPGGDIVPKREKREKVRLDENENLVLYALVKYPYLREKEIAEKTSFTRQTVNNIHRKLCKKGLLRTVRIPDIQKLGLELLVFSHVFMSPTTPLDKRLDGVSLVINEGSQVFIASNLLESAMLSFSKDYTHFQRTYMELFSAYKRNKFLEKRPVIYIFPIEDMKYFKYDYTTLTKDLLNIEMEI